MSLLRLLTAGRSLVTVRDTETRYRVTSQRLLPQFGSGKNPFAGREAATPSLAAAPEDRVQPVSPSATDEKSARAKALWLRAAERMSLWTGKLGGHLSRAHAKPAKPAVPQKAPVQGELYLDRVQVMRNDLHDADLEVVSARRGVPGPKRVEASQNLDGRMQEAEPLLVGAGRP